MPLIPIAPILIVSFAPKIFAPFSMDSDISTSNDVLIMGAKIYNSGLEDTTITGLETCDILWSITNQPTSVSNLGCGNGDILRDVAQFGRKNNYSFKLTGIDANLAAIDYANELSKDYSELNFKKIDIFSEDFKEQSYDIVLCTLFLHHFKNEELIPFLKTITGKATIGIVVNDLHRHRLAYYLFKLIGFFIKNEMVREDGLTSILRAFKKKDLENIAKELNVHFSIQWKWAFRYLWILKKDFIK